jgi:hypothetical protein
MGEIRAAGPPPHRGPENALLPERAHAADRSCLWVPCALCWHRAARLPFARGLNSDTDRYAAMIAFPPSRPSGSRHRLGLGRPRSLMRKRSPIVAWQWLGSAVSDGTSGGCGCPLGAADVGISDHPISRSSAPTRPPEGRGRRCPRPLLCRVLAGDRLVPLVGHRSRRARRQICSGGASSAIRRTRLTTGSFY